MLKLSGPEIRRRFLTYFTDRDHKRLPSSPLVPRRDPTVLLTTAGMLQFKPYFMGLESPPHARLTTVQKCFRTTDLDCVGHTARHQTFFEMLGNFGFGDYFKTEAIPWAWKFLTDDLEIPVERLWVTIFTTDDEAAEIWRRSTEVAPNRLLRLGAETNFWAAGPTGPCGPCSEIYYDLGAASGCGRASCDVTCECGRYLEVWNLVFMEFNRESSGILAPLPAKNIDTGMGLERIASVLQRVATNFETDLLRPLVDLVAARANIILGGDSKTDVALKIIADHLRGATFLLGDGLTPSNEGRGYVLRRVIRRAVRHLRQLGIAGGFVNEAATWVIENFGNAYPELQVSRVSLLETLGAEEQRFSETLERGLQLFEKALDRQDRQTISGEIAFELFDTYGFPFELTAELAAERGISVDATGFESLMALQRSRAREARERAGVSFAGVTLTTTEPTVFLGYESTRCHARVLEVLARDDRSLIVLDRTPFYPEGGGQIGDHGTIGAVRVIDTQKQGEIIVHYLAAGESAAAVGQTVDVEVDLERRMATMRHHTGTHLLGAALRHVLGPQVSQAGSYVGPDELRFDCNFPRALTPAELDAVEDLVNGEILRARPVDHEQRSYAEAIECGAIAMFGEKYGEIVRVIDIPGFSTELCGGTHARSTGEIGLLKITEERAISAGVRRIRAVCGLSALELFRKQWDVLTRLRDEFKVTTEEIPERVNRLRDQVRERDDQLRALKGRVAAVQAEVLLQDVRHVAGIRVLAAELNDVDTDGLRGAATYLREKLQSGIVVLASAAEGRVTAVAAVSPDLARRGAHAGRLVGSLLEAIGGRGGGKPDLAQGGGGNPKELAMALSRVEGLVSAQLAIKA